MGDFGNGFGGGDLNGNGHFDPGDYEMWKDIHNGSSSGGSYSGSGGSGLGVVLLALLGMVCIVFGILLAAVFPPGALILWLGIYLMDKSK